MAVDRMLFIIGFIAVIALFGFQLWSVLRTGHVKWRVQRIHRANRPVAFWFEVAACVMGLLLFAGLLSAYLVR